LGRARPAASEVLWWQKAWVEPWSIASAWFERRALLEITAVSAAASKTSLSG